jgi:hypothetical protein
MREPASRRPPGRVAPSLDAAHAPAFRSRDEQLSTVGSNQWPELPPPLEQAEDDVDAALRAWERQRRLDREQTQL